MTSHNLNQTCSVNPDEDETSYVRTIRRWVELKGMARPNRPQIGSEPIRCVALEYAGQDSHGSECIRLRPGQRVTCGRNCRADHSIETDPCLSGQHFAVECLANEVWLSDLSSTNGTIVNGDRVERIRLHNADVVLAGTTKFEVRLSLLTDKASD